MTTKPKLYDDACEDLARLFLHDAGFENDETAAELAALIQADVDDFITVLQKEVP